MHGQIERRGFQVHEVILAGQRLDGLYQFRSHLPATRGLQCLEKLLDVLAQRPGVLITQLGFERERTRLDAECVRGPHVQAQETERSQVARAEQAIEAGDGWLVRECRCD